MKRLALLLLASCGDAEPCDGVTGRCIAVHVDSEIVERIDQLELDVLYGDRHGTVTTSDGVVDLPVTTAITLPGTGKLTVGVVAAGKLSGMVLGTGAAETTVASAAHVELAIKLAKPVACIAGSFYCGGDKVAGDPDVLYQCNGGGVPLARGTCINGCSIMPADNDECAPGDLPCVEPGLYCGGDKVAGDPQTLYRCMSGVGVKVMTCADGCIIEPSPNDDHCR
ncbi:MAG TPA: hypothetical protein VFV99_27170 [Kofleriaceae bacterium]|nr:hypothetical protein [Kofleriaceae bacterium]